MVDLIIFSNVGVHPLSHWLEPGFRHVCAITRRGPYWAKADWNGLVSIEVIGGSPDEVEEYAKSVEPGCTVIRRPVELRRPARGVFAVNNCVGFTKQLIGIRSRAITPHQLYKHLVEEIKP